MIAWSDTDLHAMSQPYKPSALLAFLTGLVVGLILFGAIAWIL